MLGNYIEDPFSCKSHDIQLVPMEELTSVIKINMEETLNLNHETMITSGISTADVDATLRKSLFI